MYRRLSRRLRTSHAVRDAARTARGRGTELFQTGDEAGALCEYQRAVDLVALLRRASQREALLSEVLLPCLSNLWPYAA
jgi:hypothetical protein